MASDGYDSDSSDGKYTETSVLLGYVSKDHDENEDAISKLGGLPDWLKAEKPPSATLARCTACRNLMVLLLQLNAELPDRFPGHERRLYVFACRRGACRRKAGSIRALRGVCVRPGAQSAQQVALQNPDKQQPSVPNSAGLLSSGGLGEALFGSKSTALDGCGANPFQRSTNPFSPVAAAAAAAASSVPSPRNTHTDNSSAIALAQPAGLPSSPPSSLDKTFAEALTLSAPSLSTPQPLNTAAIAAPPEPWPAPCHQPDPYPTCYISEAEYETLDLTPTMVPANARLEPADASEPSVLDREAFESTMDATFQKFADRLAQNPDQVIRYHFDAPTPLLYSKSDDVGRRLAAGPAALPPCPNCRAPRALEVQLTPNAIAELEAGNLDLEGMEWGTIIVAVCGRDCVPNQAPEGEAAYLEEWVGVQWEELTQHK